MDKRQGITLYAVLGAALVMMIAVPVSALVLLPVAAAALVRMSTRHGLVAGAGLAVMFGIVHVFMNRTTLAYATAAALAAVYVGGATAVRRNNYIGAFAVAATAALAAVLCAAGLTAIGTDRGAVYDYIALSDDPAMEVLGDAYYRSDKYDGERVEASDENYAQESRRALAQHVADELDGHFLWYLCGFSVLCGGCAFVFASGEKSRTRYSPHVKKFPPVSDMRLPRVYLAVAFLPAALFAFLGVVPVMKQVAVAVFNTLAAMPCAFAGFTLALHTCKRFRGRARAAAYAVFAALITAALIFFDIGLLALALLGFADCVLNVRKMLDYALG